VEPPALGDEPLGERDREGAGGMGDVERRARGMAANADSRSWFNPSGLSFLIVSFFLVPPSYSTP
jgi:hypothetical protein